MKSNAIVVSNDAMTLGWSGADESGWCGGNCFAPGQGKAQGACLASDAFFPMDDTVELAAQAGITAIIQPGGSIRDQDSIDKADQYGIAMCSLACATFDIEGGTIHEDIGGGSGDGNTPSVKR